MGFLDGLFRKVVQEVSDRAVDYVKENTFLNDVEHKEQSSSGIYDKTNQENRKDTGLSLCSGERLLSQRIEEIAAGEWPQYELRQQVSSQEVGAPEGAEPYFEYGFYQGDVLVAVIMILKDNNAYYRKSVRLARQACQNRRVVYLNFMSYMKNAPEYISKRLKESISQE